MPGGKYSKLPGIILGAVVFITMEAASLIMISRNGQMQNLRLSGMAHSFMGVVWGSTESIRHYMSLGKENEALALENAEMYRQLLYFYEREAQIEAYKDMGESPVDFSFTPATILKMSRGSQHNYFIINKGNEDGIRPQSGVITRKGVVGIIDAVDKHYSYGISLMNGNLNVSARIGRTGAVGPLAWDGVSKDRAILREIPLQHKITPGDTVMTSGYSSIFPPDIPLGVAGKSKIVNGAVYEIEVLLFENFSSLRYVTVVENNGRDEIINLENLESGEADN